jgi:protein gp37
MNRTKIEWVVDPDGKQGHTWNPVTGCRHGCEYCYASRLAGRFGGTPLKTKFIENAQVEQVVNGKIKDQTLDVWPDFETSTFWDARICDPLHRKKPTTIFTCSMADLFGKWVPDKWITDVLNIAWQCTHHKFLFLTKNPKRYKSFEYPGNCWLGTTVTSMDDAWRINKVRKLENNFLSCEPLLGDLSGADLRGIKWIIIGSLNRNGRAVPVGKGGTRAEWVEALVEEADIRDIPVFVKDSLWASPILKEWRQLPYLGEIKELKDSGIEELAAEEREKPDADGSWLMAK